MFTLKKHTSPIARRSVIFLKAGFLASYHHSLPIMVITRGINENSLFTVAGPRRTFADFPFLIL